MPTQPVSPKTLERLPAYLSYLKSVAAAQPRVSATSIADALGLNQVQVRKDLQAVSGSGRPRIGYDAHALIHELGHFLGYDNANDAVLVGAGRMGRALMSYGGFSQLGLNILAGFDLRAEPGGFEGKKPILPMDRLEDFCRRLNVHIGIITVPAAAAQEAADRLIRAGVLAIWNFAPATLAAPAEVLVQNENMAASLAILSKHLAARLKRDEANPEIAAAPPPDTRKE